MAPQMWIYGVGAVATISKKLECIAVEYESTFGVVDQAALALAINPRCTRSRSMGSNSLLFWAAFFFAVIGLADLADTCLP